MQQNTPPNPEKKNTEGIQGEDGVDKVKSYAKYSGLAIQMGILIVLGAFGGRQLDRWAGTGKPYFTMVGSLLGIFAALYIVLKDLYFSKKQ